MRRSINIKTRFGVSLAAALCLFPILKSWAGSRDADWPQWLGPNRDGTWSGPALASTWPKAGPPQLWKRDVGQGFSGPVVVEGKLVLFHRLGNEEVVECLDADHGQSLWKFAYPTRYRDDFGFDEGPRATPLIADGRVYTFGAQGPLHCLRLADGQSLWHLDTQQAYGTTKGFFGMACSPLLEGDSLILNLGGKQGAGIVAFDSETGREQWRATDAEASYSSPVAASIGNKRYLFVFNREGLVTLDPSDGRVYSEFPWRPPIHASVNAATPLVIGDEIFVSTSYGRGAILLRFREAGPQKIWAGDDILSNHYATSVPHEGYLYGFDGRQEQGCVLRCVERETGKIRWSEDGLRAGSITLANGRLFVLTERGELMQAPATPQRFEPTGRAQILGLQVRAFPALAQGKLYARSKRELVCVDLRAAP